MDIADRPDAHRDSGLRRAVAGTVGLGLLTGKPPFDPGQPGRPTSTGSGPSKLLLSMMSLVFVLPKVASRFRLPSRWRCGRPQTNLEAKL